MKFNNWPGKVSGAVVTATILTLSMGMAHAQQEPPKAPNQPDQQNPQKTPPPTDVEKAPLNNLAPYGSKMPWLRPMGGKTTLATAPIEALAKPLDLSLQQQIKLRDLQDEFRGYARLEQRRAGLEPIPPQAYLAGDMAMPSEAEMSGMMAKRQALDQKVAEEAIATNTRMSMVLTSKQTDDLESVLQSVDILNAAGIPGPLQAKLDIGASQRRKLSVIAEKSIPGMMKGDMKMGMKGDMKTPPPAEKMAMDGPAWDEERKMHEARRSEARTAVWEVLTESQRKEVEIYEASRPMRPRMMWMGEDTVAYIY